MKNIKGVELKKFTYQVLKSFKQDYTDFKNFRDAELVLEDTIELESKEFSYFVQNKITNNTQKGEEE